MSELATRLDPHHAKAVLSAVEGNPLHEAGECLSGRYVRYSYASRHHPGSIRIARLVPGDASKRIGQDRRLWPD